MPNDKFLDELKIQYEKEFELKTTLETKANYTLVSAGVVVGLLFAFGATLIDTFEHIPNFTYILFSVLVGVILFVASILFSVLTLGIKEYRYATLHEYFYTAEGIFDEEAIGEYRNMEADKFLDDRIKTYLRSNRINYAENEKKATKINIAQWLFFAGMIIVPITILGFILSAMPK